MGNHLPPPLKPAGRRFLAADDIVVTTTAGRTFGPVEHKRIISLDGEWKFSGLAGAREPFGELLDPERAGTEFDDSSWKSIPVPKSFYFHPGSSYDEILKDGNNFFRGWYRRTIDLPEKLESVMLEFDAIGYAARLFVNGKEAGSHHGDFVPFIVDVTDFIRLGSNLLALCVDSDFGYSIAKRKTPRSYGCKWDVASIRGGIWGSARAIVGTATTIGELVLNPKLDGAVEFSAIVTNRQGRVLRSLAVATILSADLGAPSSQRTVLGELELTPGRAGWSGAARFINPRLWSPADPNLYFLVLHLESEAGEVLGSLVQRFGFREFTIDGTSFLLNGKPFFLAGESLHSNQFGGRGPDENVREKAEKWIGSMRSERINVLRTVHQPVVETVLDVADELGMGIYDEWSFTFIDRLDEPAFERNNLEEFRRWFLRDCNHPSVIMWSLGNENNQKNDPAVNRQLNLQAKLMRNLDPQKRPLCAFSGMATFVFFGENKLDTDFLDLHHYHGISGPWTTWDEQFEQSYRQAINLYGDGESLQMPYVIWECVGGGWGVHFDDGYKLGDKARYIENLTHPAANPGNPRAALYSAVAGLAPVLDRKLGNAYMQRYLAARLGERMRQDTRIAGFAPWIVFPGIAQYARFAQTTMPGLRDNPVNKLMPRQLVSPSKIPLQAFVANGGESISKAVIQVTLKTNGTIIGLATIPLDGIEAQTVQARDFTLAIPELPSDSKAEIQVTLLSEEQPIGWNGYEVTIHSRHELLAPIRQAETLHVMGKSPELEPILKQLGIKYEILENPPEFPKVRRIVVPWDAELADIDGKALRNWVEKGGYVLFLEAGPGAIPGFDELKRVPSHVYFAEMIEREHRVFHGLVQADLDTWAENKHGWIVKNTLSPIDLDTVIATGKFIGGSITGACLSQKNFGKGRMLIDSSASRNLWLKNGAATRYLRNLITCLLEENTADLENN